MMEANVLMMPADLAYRAITTGDALGFGRWISASAGAGSDDRAARRGLRVFEVVGRRGVGPIRFRAGDLESLSDSIGDAGRRVDAFMASLDWAHMPDPFELAATTGASVDAVVADLIGCAADGSEVRTLAVTARMARVERLRAVASVCVPLMRKALRDRRRVAIGS